jgi:hypothetical protein
VRIFVANTGRCGTKFMAQAMGALTDIPSFHEQSPFCIGETSKEINNDCISGPTRAIIDEKIEKVKACPNYFEASNMFIKSFVWPFLDAFDDLHVVYLHRNPMDTFVSHAERGWKLGWDWLLQPRWKRNFLRSDEPMTYLEGIMWNWFEVRERFLRLRPRFRKTYDFDFRKIGDMTEYHKMLDHFGIPYRRIYEMPQFDRNENKAGESVTMRYEAILEDLNTKWDEPGIEWAFKDR